jgi:UDP-glucose 4-epimerase
MRVLITGGAGFIGSHLAEALLDRGDEVFVLDNLSTGSITNVDHLRNRAGFNVAIDTVTNERVVAELVDYADTVVHLAAAVGAKLVVDEPVRTIETNVNGTEVVLRHASKKRKPVLIASTSEVYGHSEALPFREDEHLVIGPTSVRRWGYAASKILDECLALAYWHERRLPVIVVRLFNTVGPKQTSRYGMVIPTFVRQALAGEPITVHGDGSQTRSFTYVGDVASAMMALLQEPRAVGEIINIGNAEETSILALGQKIKALTDSSSELTLVPYAQALDDGFEDVRRRIPDLRKIRTLIGYEPKVRLSGILQRVVEYWRTEQRSVAAPSVAAPAQHIAWAIGRTARRAGEICPAAAGVATV